MDDLLPMITGGAVIATLALGGLFIGSCVRDYASSTPRVVDVLVTDKRYEPDHYTVECSGDPVRCTQTYHPPSWTVEYADETRHWMSVSRGTYDAVSIGEKKVIRFDLGGGYWKARYNERFEFGPLVAEGSWPAR